jgi:hypothetical protein
VDTYAWREGSAICPPCPVGTTRPDPLVALDEGCIDGTCAVIDISAYPENSGDGYNSPNNPSEDKKTVIFILVGVLGAIVLVILIVFFMMCVLRK